MAAQDLRPYQRHSFDELRNGFAAGHRRQVLVVPTGGGKTTIAAKLIESTLAKASRPNAVLFMAHRTELISQCSERLDENGITAHGVIMSSHPRRRPFAPVQVASVDTLANRKPLDPPPVLIIADECHRTLGGRQTRVIQELYPTAFVIGLTATPWRLDRRGLGQYDADGQARMFSRMVVGATYSQLIGDGFILEPRVCCPWKPDLTGVEITDSGDYNEEQLAEVCDTPQTIRDAVDRWLELSNGARTVAFAASIDHSLHLVEAFNAAGVRAAHLDGTTDPDERKSILAKLKAHELDVVSNFNVLGEGWDCPACEVCILARPTTSLALYMQMVGRVLRPAIAAGKTRALVLDLAGSVLRHGWPTADRNWTLADRPKRGRKGAAPPEECDAPPVGVCPACLFARPTAEAGKPCPNCGYVEPVVVKPADLESTSGVPLVELTREAVEAAVRPPPQSSWARRAFGAPPGQNRAYNAGTYNPGKWGGRK